MPSEGSKAAPSLPLFRAEALARFSASPWQPPLLSKPISGPLFASFAVFATAALVVFAATYEFARKEMATGHLTPVAGWSQVRAQSFAIVRRRPVEAGNVVEMGDVLYELGSGDGLEAGTSVEGKLLDDVRQRRAALEAQQLGAERLREDAWGTHYVQALNADFRLARFGAHVAFGGASLAALQTVALLVLGAGKVVDGTLTLGMLLAFSSYANLFSSKTHAVIESLVELGLLRLHRERIADIALEEREAQPDSAAVRIDLQGRVEARSLSFSYGDHSPSILNDFSLLVSPGEFVAIAGRSGVGKSTLVKLLCKLLTPEAGVLFIDGADINSLDLEHYRGQLGVVMQDDDLFSGSLIENIAMSEGQADLEQVRQVAALACIHDDIERMPMGYHTLVGPMGSTLSGGQRQRVMIARALYRRPALILMDEGTAHLDEDLQRQVFDNLMATGTTTIAVTHDERVLTRADRWISLGDGSASPQNAQHGH